MEDGGEDGLGCEDHGEKKKERWRRGNDIEKKERDWERKKKRETLESQVKEINRERKIEEILAG